MVRKYGEQTMPFIYHSPRQALKQGKIKFANLVGLQ